MSHEGTLTVLLVEDDDVAAESVVRSLNKLGCVFPVVWAAAGLPTAVFPVPHGTLRTLANAMVAPIKAEPIKEEPIDSAAETGSGEDPSNDFIENGHPTAQNAGV